MKKQNNKQLLKLFYIELFLFVITFLFTHPFYTYVLLMFNTLFAVIPLIVLFLWYGRVIKTPLSKFNFMGFYFFKNVKHLALYVISLFIQIIIMANFKYTSTVVPLFIVNMYSFIALLIAVCQSKRLYLSH